MKKGKLISLEGGEGAGKSTVLAHVAQILQQRKIEALHTREPGGTDLGEALRKIILSAEFGMVCAESELLMMFAARAQLVREVIEPAINSGKWVLTDRFTDASYAYQGGGRGITPAIIFELEHWAAKAIRPDLTLLLDLPVEQGLQRANQRGEPDRIEQEQAEFFERVRSTYRERARIEPKRFRVIDAAQNIDQVKAQVSTVINAWLDDHG